jgi:DNA-binding CsgD family transcriptional regulator
MELLGVIGFSLMLGWFFPTFFWFFVSTPPELSRQAADVCLTLLFSGLPLGYLFIRVLALWLKERFYNRHRNVLLVVAAIIMASLPMLVLGAWLGHYSYEVAYYPVCLLAGMAAAWFITSWLDICGKTRIRNILIFTTASYAGGALLFFLCVMMPVAAQPIVCDGFLLVSLCLLFYMGSRSNMPDAPIVRARGEFLTSPRELDPSFVTLGMVFGIGFVLLFSLGPQAIMFAILVVLVAAALMMTLAILNLKISVVLLLRVLIIITVGDFLLLAVAPEWLWVAASCVIAGAWVVFTTANSANLVKLVLDRNLSIFSHVSLGLVPVTTGFICGWLVTMLLLHAGLSKSEVPSLLLGAVFLVVLSIMVFYPEKKHHDDNAAHSSDFIVKLSAGSNSEESVLAAKCDAVSRLYKLSPREGDILMYLVRGRNAEYIRTKLVISAHTVKSHIYSIYLKTNVHSQQKLMDLIEEFPMEAEE